MLFYGCCVYIYLVGPVPVSQGFKYYLTVWTDSLADKKRLCLWKITKQIPSSVPSTLCGFEGVLLVYAFCFSKPCYLQVDLCVRRHSKSQRPQYSGPYRIVSRSSQTAMIHIRGSDAIVSSDHLKPAYVMTDKCCPSESTYSTSAAKDMPDEPVAPSQHLNRRR
ncbi:hypothetical protein J6590_083153 [Homalodisca vitripennis]|nr:hypothetical protein J6590_083153 [Homalodisca vitripennis]